MNKCQARTKEGFALLKSLIIILVLGVAFLVIFAWILPSIKSYFSPYPKGTKLFHQGYFSAAITEFEKALESCEESARPKVYYMIARCYKDQAPPNLDKAIEYYRLVYENYPHNYLADDAKAWEGHCEYERNNFKKAMKLYSELMENPIGNGDECNRLVDLRMATVQYILKKRGLLEATREEIIEDFWFRVLSTEEKNLIWGILDKERNFEVLYLFNFYENYLQKHYKDYEVMYKYYNELIKRGEATKAYAQKEKIKGKYRMKADIVDIKNDYMAGYYRRVIRKIDGWLEKFKIIDTGVTADMYYIRGSCLMRLGDVEGVIENLLGITDSPYSSENSGKKLFKETILYLLQDVSLSEIGKTEKKLDLSRYGKRLISLLKSWHYWQEFDYKSLNELLDEVTHSSSFNDYNKFERSTVLLEAEIVNLLMSKNQLVENKEEIDRLIAIEIQVLKRYLLEAAKKKSEIYSKVFRIYEISNIEMYIAWVTQMLQEYALRGDIQLIHHIIMDPDSLSVVDLLKKLYPKKTAIVNPIMIDLLYGRGIASLPSHLYDFSVGTLGQSWEKNDYHLFKNKAMFSFLKILFLTYLKHENLADLAEASALFHCEFLGQGILSPFSSEFGIESLPLQVRYHNLSRAKTLFSGYLREDQINIIDPTLDKFYIRNLVSQYLGRAGSIMLDL